MTNVQRQHPFCSQRVKLSLTIFCSIFGSYRGTAITYLSSPITRIPWINSLQVYRGDVKLNEVPNSMVTRSPARISIIRPISINNYGVK